MESVCKSAIAALKLKIRETEEIRKRQETELAEMTQVLEDIQRHTTEMTRQTLAKLQAERGEKQDQN